jgi:hypothetical protein
MKGANESAATDDTTSSLSMLRARAGRPLRDVVLEIYAQNGRANNKSTGFLTNLKCFLPVETGGGHLLQHDGRGKPVKILLAPCSRVRPYRYVALSYPCHPSYGESNTKGGYEWQKGIVSVRDTVLDRTIRFIQYKQGLRGMIPFWIDKLSIEQHDPSEREEGMQSMDLVYKRCAFAVGYLWVEVKTQVQLDHLSNLLGGRIVDGLVSGQWPTLKEGIDARTSDEVLDLLVQITDDPWWSRAWIFQEDYLTWKKMWLLIRHAQGLDKTRAPKEIGCLPGELVVKSHKLRTYATLFCLALCRRLDQRPCVKTACEKVLRKAGKYDLLHRYGGSRWNIQSTMTIKILKDLDKRDISVPSDLLAIAANVCGYNVRIMAANKNTPKLSLSLGILTLCVSNGEIIRNDDEKIALYENIFDFLEDRALRITTPLTDRALTFIKHCRLSATHLSPAGIHTKGLLWKLSDPIRPKYPQHISHSIRKHRSQKDISRPGLLDDYQRKRLLDLVGVLKQRIKRRYKHLANDLEAYLAKKPSAKIGEWPPSSVMDAMAAYIVDAMDTGKYLQVACLSGPSGVGRGAYRAIFVRDRSEIQRPGPTYVFTSWMRTKKQARNGVECKTLAKYVSMEVSLDQTAQRSPQILRSKGWINGLCFFRGEMKSSFVFAWPKSLCE